MDWKDLAEKVSGFAPLLGGLLGGPAGAAVGSIIASTLGTSASPSDVAQALVTNPDAAIKLKQIEVDQSVKLQELAVTAENNRLTAETANVAAVNATMQAEAKSDHWPTYAWRPFIGFVFGIDLLIASLTTAACYIGSMFGLPGAAQALATLPAMIGALGAINGAAVPILGIASWFRGKAQADPNVRTDARG
jgi:hypothetical protein